MAARSTAEFCRYTVSANHGRFVTDPVRLGALFREYTDTKTTPDIRKTVELILSMGIKIEPVKYLETGGVNMSPNGAWHIHYAAKDKPATQKFDILHELFEVVHKSFNSLYPDYPVIKEPYLSRYADRFAAATLIPKDFFVKRLVETGCDVVKLGESLELSHQCLLVAMRQHLGHIPFVGALYDYQPQAGIRSRYKTNDYRASLVVKTGLARGIKDLCWLQPEPVLNESPKTGSLVCAALYDGCSILYRGSGEKSSQSVLVRPLFSNPQKPYRVILLAIPSDKIKRFSPQTDSLDTVVIDENSPCPTSYRCRTSLNCRWKNQRRTQ